MHIEPQSPRYTLETTSEGQRAVVPARRNWFVILFLCAWLVGWVFGEVSVVHQLLSPSENTPQLFLLAWLTGWTLGGAFALAAVLWQLACREVISVKEGLNNVKAWSRSAVRTAWIRKIAEVSSASGALRRACRASCCLRADYSRHRHQLLSRHPQVRQREQSDHVRGVLRQTTEARVRSSRR